MKNEDVINIENLFATEFSIAGVDRVFYEGNQAGYRYEYGVDLDFRDERYHLIFQAQDPQYLSAEWVSRENGGDDTAGFDVSRDTRDLDDQDKLTSAILKAIGAPDNSDLVCAAAMCAVSDYVKSQVEMEPDGDEDD